MVGSNGVNGMNGTHPGAHAGLLNAPNGVNGANGLNALHSNGPFGSANSQHISPKEKAELDEWRMLLARCYLKQGDWRMGSWEEKGFDLVFARSNMGESMRMCTCLRVSAFVPPLCSA